ncbi:MAG TPA: metallophosphoesterase [Blastocatellia bacterium]|nr:metallophosphoesterase [Blastocatellia bacterium]
MNQHIFIDQLVTISGRTLLLIAGRTVLSLLLISVQLYVLRALVRIIHSWQLIGQKARLLKAVVVGFVTIVNLPLVFFFIEGFFRPNGLLLYSPPRAFESAMRPFGYVFFVWTFGSLFFAAASPVVMACFAFFQFFLRKPAARNKEATVEALDLSRRRFLRTALTAVSAMPFAVSAYGAVAARTRNVIEKVIVPIPDLPSQLEGLTIVQLSDIHAGMFMKESEMAEYVRIANSLKPDLIALTGDFVATHSDQVAPFMRAMSPLQARYGVFGCLGNHDMFTRSEEALARGFANAGFKLLRNNNEIIEIDGAVLNVIGVDYFATRSTAATLDGVLKRISLEGTTILLQHAPQLFPQAANVGIDLTLSGHTHGGQIALTIGEMIITPAALSTMFLAGLFKIGDSHLYVNRGLGTTGPPIRINAPPEITHVTLKAR